MMDTGRFRRFRRWLWPAMALTLSHTLLLPAAAAADDAPKVDRPRSEQKRPAKAAAAPKTPKDHDHDKLEGDLKASASDSIQWKRSFDTAVSTAAKTKRPLLVDFEAEWCGFCKKLDRETYAHASVIRFITNTFVSAKVDVDKHPELKARFKINGLPTIVFLSAVSTRATATTENTEGNDTFTLQEIGRIEGYRPPEQFLHEARKAATAGKSLAQLREAAAASPEDVDAQRAYARALLASRKPAEAATVLRKALEHAPGHPLIVFELADLDRLRGKFEPAAQSYREVLASEAADEAVKDEVIIPLARCLVSLKKLEEAEKTLGTLLAKLPARAVTPEKKLEETKEASSPDNAEPKVDARFLEALFLRGYVRALLERPKDALADLEIAQNADPNGIWGFRASFIIARTR